MTPTIWNLILRILVAGLLGGLVGLERELRAKEAGVRTHFLVALGSGLLMVISQFGFTGSFDASRVAAQVVSGMGFIGAGTIIFQKNAVRGLTTAAGIWVAAAIGLACGGGMYLLAGAATLLAILILELMNTLQLHDRNLTVAWSADDKDALMRSLGALRAAGLNVLSYTLQQESTAETPGRYVMRAEFRVSRKFSAERLSALLDTLSGVHLESIVS
ncbi:MAG: MgtC/SapB family protein [Bacteroidales bacterium]|nr:MgtC/SapB family protein [Bacteroidales bacterium]